MNNKMVDPVILNLCTTTWRHLALFLAKVSKRYIIKKHYEDRAVILGAANRILAKEAIENGQQKKK